MPIRRVNQAYVIATSTKVDISGVKVDKFDDKYFARDKKAKAKKTEGELFETEKEVCLDSVWHSSMASYRFSSNANSPAYSLLNLIGNQESARFQEGWPEGCGCWVDQGYRGCPRPEILSWCPVLSQGRRQAPWDDILS